MTTRRIAAVALACMPLLGWASPALAQDRVLWVHSIGKFTKTEGKTWTDEGKRGDDAWRVEFVETKRTPMFVELYDKTRDLTVQLFNDRCMVREGKKKFEKHFDGKWAASAATSNKDKIVGAWEAPKTKDFPVDILLAFAKDGKLKLTIKAAQPITKDLTYEIDGDKIVTTRTENGKEMRDTWTIRTLTENQLTYVDGRGTVMECKKK